MAYFSNGSEGCNYESRYCIRCINWRDHDDGRGAGCPVWDAHLLYSYEECNSKSNAKAILDMLIPMDKETTFAAQCSMFQKAPQPTPNANPNPNQ